MQNIMEQATYRFLMELDKQYGLLTIPEKIAYIGFKMSRHKELEPFLSKAYHIDQALIDYDYIIDNIEDDPIKATAYLHDKLEKITEHLEKSNFFEK